MTPANQSWPIAPDTHGLMLEVVARVCPAANQAFSGIAYLRKIAGHRRGVAREMAALAAEPVGFSPPRHKPGLPGGRSRLDLKVCNCARCGRTLLGESDEYVRNLARDRGMRCVHGLPGPVACRGADGRPYCGNCGRAVA